MTLSDRQLGLFPEGCDQVAALLHGFETTPGKVTDLMEFVSAEIAEFMDLKIPPQVLHRVQFRGIRREKSDLDIDIVPLHIAPHQLALVRLQPVPNDEQRSRDLPVKGLEERDDLRSLDAARKQAEIELPESDTRNDRELVPGEAVLQHRGLSPGRPGPDTGRPFRQSGLIDKDYRLASFFGVFLVPATVVASSAGSPVRLAGWRARWDAGRKSPSPGAGARRGLRCIGCQTARQSRPGCGAAFTAQSENLPPRHPV